MNVQSAAPVWGHGDLVRLKADAAKGWSLFRMAEAQGPGVSKRDCDYALWALVGRTVDEACDYLNKGKTVVPDRVSA